MPNITHIKNVLFKALLVAVFGAFFFVQAQATFIFYAYGGDFAQHSSAGVTTNNGSHVKAANISNRFHNHFKLNKRYQVVCPHAILPAQVQLPVYFTQVRLRWLIPPVLASTHFLYTKPLRGPPFI